MMQNLFVAAVGVCLVVEYSTSECERRFVRKTIRFQNCRSKRVLTYGCRGTCSSYTKPSSTRPDILTHYCQCCHDAEKRFVSIRLVCPNIMGHRRFKMYRVRLAVPTRCSCRSCSALPTRIVPSEPEYLHV